MNYDKERARNQIVEDVYQGFLAAVDKQELLFDELEWQFLAILCGKRLIEGAEISLQKNVLAKEFVADMATRGISARSTENAAQIIEALGRVATSTRPDETCALSPAACRLLLEGLRVKEANGKPEV